MPNNLPRAKQVAIVNALVEGCSMRATARLTDTDRKTVGTLLTRVGDGCAVLLDEKMRNLSCERLELDELWSFVQKKQRHVTDLDDETVGDAWTFVAIDSNTKLVPTFMVGKRDSETTEAFIADLAWRLRRRVQLSTDGFGAYAAPIVKTFGGQVDYATIVKQFEAEAIGPGRYSPPKVTGTEKTPVCGAPLEELVSTSYAERQNLSVRMGCRRYTRLSNAFSKKLEAHVAATALHYAHYNFVRQHQTLRTSPAMAAGVETTLWSINDLLDATLNEASS